MKNTRLYTLWVEFLALLMTADISIRAIVKSFQGTISRSWVDKTLNAWVDRLCSLIGIQYKVINPHNTMPKPNVPTLLMCNHSSLFDIPLSFKVYPNHSIRMLSKKELGQIPFFGRAMIASEFPFVDRKNRVQAIKDLEKLKESMENGLVMWISPEGTRSKDGKLSPFKKGGFITAIQAKATIIPLGIRGAYEILPAKSSRLNFNRKVEIHIGEPIDASEYSLDNKEELMVRVHNEMKKLVNES